MADLQSTICSYEGGAICRPKHFDCACGILAGRRPPNAENHHFDLCCDPGCGAASQLGRSVSPDVSFGAAQSKSRTARNNKNSWLKISRPKHGSDPCKSRS